MSRSSNSDSGSTKGGVGFCGLLALAFIVLKLTGVITWSWVWVLSPIWVPFVLWLLIVVLIYKVIFKL